MRHRLLSVLFLTASVALPVEASKANENIAILSSNEGSTVLLDEVTPFIQPSESEIFSNSSIFESNTAGLPGSVSDIFTNDGGVFESGPGSIPTEVWDVIQSETVTPVDDWLSGGNISLENIWDSVLTGQRLPDYGSIFGNGDILGNIDYGNIFGDVNIFGDSDFGNGVIKNLNGGIFGAGATNPNGGSQPTAESGRFNPFKWITRWTKNNVINPVVRALGRIGERPRLPFKSPALGTLTRNSVVKRRDQANLLDQEIGRLLAAPRLGEEGEEWIAQESAESMQVLERGVNEADLSIKLAAEAQELTSTQDVAKAVARLSGHNAQAIAATLQMQAQTQASSIQLQQLMAADVALAADISEGIDEANRRERLERGSTFYDNAGETLYLRGVLTDNKDAKQLGSSN